MASTGTQYRPRRDFADVFTRAVLALETREGGRRATIVRWALPLLATLLVALVQYAALPEPAIAPFVFLYFAVAVSAGVAGRGPGLLCVLLSASVANYVFMSPHRGWSVTHPALVATGLFLLGGILVAVVCASFRSSLLRVDASARELERRGELLRLSHDAILVWSLDGTIEFWNRGAEQLYGFTSDEARGRVSHDLLRTVFPRPWSEIRDELRERLEWKGELTHRTRDGRTVIVSTNLQLVRTADGVERVLEANRDITDQKRTEQRLRAVYDLGIVGVLYWTIDGVITGANDKFLEITGYGREDLGAGRINWVEMTPPEWRLLDEKALAECRATGRTPPFEKEYLRKDGSRVPIIVGGAMLDETRREGVAFVIDISDRKKAEQALRESEQRLRAMFDKAALGIVEVDARDRFVAVNDRLCEILEYRRAELLGKTVHELTAPEDRPVSDQMNADVRAGRRDRVEYEKRYLRRDGTRQWVRVAVSALRDAAGTHRGAIGTVEDIGRRKAAEAERDKLIEALKDADRRKNDFLGMLSHELRNPLAPIRNSVYILGRAAPGGEQARRALAVIDRQVQHTTRLVDDLLDVTRITRGKVRLQRERVDLGELARRTAEDYRDLFATNGIRLDVNVDVEPVIVHADATRLAQVIGNLLQNAAKFTPRGGRTTLTLGRSDGFASLTMRDTGAGIPPDVLARLFEPFAQGESTLDRSTGGLGLGLALVKGLVELHGGTASGHSDGAGRGATFTVRLPLERRKSPRFTVVPARPALRDARRVLVIEDNVDAAATLKEALELNEHVVDVAHTGPEGLEKVRSLKPDVVLCDIGLPGMDGFHVARSIRADPAVGGVALIALSGYAQAEDLERSKEAGFDLHLAKPPDIEALERAIVQVRGSAAGSEAAGSAAPPGGS